MIICVNSHATWLTEFSRVNNILVSPHDLVPKIYCWIHLVRNFQHTVVWMYSTLQPQGTLKTSVHTWHSLILHEWLWCHRTPTHRQLSHNSNSDADTASSFSEINCTIEIVRRQRFHSKIHLSFLIYSHGIGTKCYILLVRNFQAASFKRVLPPVPWAHNTWQCCLAKVFNIPKMKGSTWTEWTHETKGQNTLSP